MRVIIFLVVVVGIGFGIYKSYFIVSDMANGDFLGETEIVGEVFTQGDSESSQEVQEVKPAEEKKTQILARKREREKQELEQKLDKLESIIEKSRRQSEEDKKELKADRIARDKKREVEGSDFVIHQFQNRQAPTIEDIGKLLGNRLVIDQRSNTVVVAVNTPEDLVKIAGVLSALDVGPVRSQYRVEAVIVNAALTHGDEFSIEWLAKYEYPGRPLSDWAFGLGSGNVGIESTWLDLAIEKAETTGALSVIARPALILGQGEKATISSGREIPIPISNAQDGNVQTSIEFRRVALQLEVELKEIGPKRIALGILQINEQISGETIIGDNAIPELASQRWETQIEPVFGRWYAVGGVSSDSHDRSKRWGWLFKNRDDETKSRREIGLFIRVVPVDSEKWVPDSPSDLIRLPDSKLRAVPVPFASAVPVSK